MICPYTSIAYAKDRSSITILIHNSINTAKDTPAEVLLIDPQNRRTGFDATAPFNTSAGVTEIHEIPRSNYSIEGIGDDSGEGLDEPNYRELWVPEPLPGEYIIQIIGKQDGSYRLSSRFHNSDLTRQEYNELGFIVAGQTVAIKVGYSPVPGAPALVVTKTVTFDILRQDLTAAQQLNQLGDDKFVSSLTKTITLAEKLSGICDKHEHRKDKHYRPAISVLELFVKRLEAANRKCDATHVRDCDEDKDWEEFGKKYRKDHDYNDFFREWDRDDWHMHKKRCKRFVTDEALKIIREDAGLLIKSLGGEIDKYHEKDIPDNHNGKDGRGGGR
jgi:hypothetical protein